MKDYTIAEEFVLPSLGKVYTENVNPNVKLRAMTTEDEMRRLSRTNKPHKLLCDIIDDCLVEKPGISSYDMCLPDQQFLLFKLRTVTYGSDYKMPCECPHCLSKNDILLDMDDLVCNSYTDSVNELFEITLPVTKHTVKYKLQTPRMLENVDAKIKEAQRRHSVAENESAFLFNLTSIIDLIDGESVGELEKEDFIRSLPMRDTNYLANRLNKLTESFGIIPEFNITCDVCGLEFPARFRAGSEFFRPTIDD